MILPRTLSKKKSTVLPPESERLRTRTTWNPNEKFEQILSRKPNAQHVVRVCLCVRLPSVRPPICFVIQFVVRSCSESISCDFRC